MTRKFGILLATAALPLTLAGCFTQGADDADALRVALQFNPVAEFSPYSDDAVLVTRAGGAEMIVGMDEDGMAVPELAESWEVKDARTVVFTLPEGVTFQDGTPVDGESVANSLSRSIGAAARPKGLGSNTLEATATGEREVTVTSDKDDPILVNRFADPGTMILSPGVYSGEAPDPFGHGTGPFTLTTKNLDGAVSAEAFADYRLGAPATEALTVSFIEDSAARVNALRAAVAAAIDAEPVVRDIFEGQAATPKGSIFNRSSDWADATPETTVQPGAEGEGKKVTLATWDSRPELPDTANLVADQLRKMGFDVDVTVADYNSLEPDMLEGNFDLIVGSRNYMIGASDPISFLQSDFTCASAYNLSQLCDADIDKAAELTDPEERLAAAARIGAMIVADGAAVPLAHERLLVATDGVTGIDLNPMERHLITEKTAK